MVYFMSLHVSIDREFGIEFPRDFRIFQGSTTEQMVWDGTQTMTGVSVRPEVHQHHPVISSKNQRD